jgi:hypothetical protein
MPDCRVCKLPNVGTHEAQGATIRYFCARCGHYSVILQAMEDLPSIEDDLRPRFSRWIREQNRLGSQPTIRVEDIATISNIVPLTFSEKSDRVLEILAEQTKRFGQEFQLGSLAELAAFTETFAQSDLTFIGRYLEERGFLYDSTKMSALRLTGGGFERVEKNRQVNKSSSQAFVAMWFNPELDPVWQAGFGAGIRSAGYDPLRIDGKQHNHKICDEIVAEIRRSRFLVGDFTGHGGGVYYETGFASGLGIPVIFTCRKDHLKELHFDVRQFNTIDWTDSEDLAKRLEERISATIGDGPRRV